METFSFTNRPRKPLFAKQVFQKKKRPRTFYKEKWPIFISQVGRQPGLVKKSIMRGYIDATDGQGGLAQTPHGRSTFSKNVVRKKRQFGTRPKIPKMSKKNVKILGIWGLTTSFCMFYIARM